MNDRELELRLRSELRSLGGPADAPASLYDHVSRLGMGDSTAGHEWRTPPYVQMATHRLEPTRRAVGWWSLAAALALVAVIVGALFLRYSQRNGSANVPKGTLATPAATASVAPTPFPTWSGAPAVVVFGGRLGADFGWVETESAGWLYVTDDGGNTWRDVTPAELAGKFKLPPSGSVGWAGPLDITFSDPQNGWLFFEDNLRNDPSGRPISDHTFYRTADGGRSWIKSSFPAEPACQVLRSDWLDNRRGVAQCEAGLRAELWSTTDGGSTWTMVSSADTSNPQVAWPMWLELQSPLEFWGVTQTNPPQPHVLHSLDGGKTWTAAELPDLGESTFFGFDGLPMTVDGRLVVSAELGRGDSAAVPGLDFVTWTSTDSGAHWKLETTTHLGNVSSLGSPILGWTIPFLDAKTKTVRLFDRASRSFAATVQTAGFCSEASGGVVTSAWAATAEDVWASCEYPQSKGDAMYLYGTMDGGRTWRPLMGSPKP